MADPKYANLPGIAFDQPDVFETTGAALPEADQDWAAAAEMALDSDPVVETLHVSANEAFGKFKGKYLDARKTDFSDRITPAKGRGYITWSGDLEVLNKDFEETPLQKYQRLNCEIRELAEEIQKIQDEGEEKAKEKGIAKNVAGKVDGLRDELSALKLEELLGSALAKNLDDGKSGGTEKLLSHIERIKAVSDKKSSTDTAAASAQGESGKVTYELLLGAGASKGKASEAEGESSETLARLDRRLEALEKALGATTDTMNSLSVETGQKTLLGALKVLNSRSALLEPEHLDHVEGRLAALQMKMNSMAEKRKTLEDEEKNNKICQLYDLASKLEVTGQTLPDVIDRLDALSGLHEQAQEFSKALMQLDNVQAKLAKSLGSNETVLKETQKQLGENMENIQKNLESVDQRLTKLK